MKSKIIYLSLILLTAFATSCKDDSTATPSKSMKGDIDGKSWSASKIGATFRYGVLVISGESSSGETVIIRIEPYEGFETAAPYKFYYDDDSDIGIYMEKAGANAYATNQYDVSNLYPGEVVLTKFDKTNKIVSGTCTMDVKRVIDNKEKSISVTFTEIPWDDKIPPTPGQTMSCTVDGKSWTASAVNSLHSSAAKMIQIVGNASNGTTVGLAVPNDATIGTYDISTFGTTRGQFNPTPTTFRTSNNGTITITEHDKDADVIKGTFSFKANSGSDTTVVTNGKFVSVY